MIELILALFVNLQCLAGITAFVWVVYRGITLMQFSTSAVEIAKVAGKREFKYWIALGLIASIPGVGDLWRVRIGLLKYQMASPENVQKGVEEIGRIAEKLECKYLGCKRANKTNCEDK
jgi:hypothetical protein